MSKYIIGIIASIAFLFGCWIYTLQGSTEVTEEAVEENEDEIENVVEEESVSDNAGISDEIVQKVTGADAARIAKDTSIVKEFLQNIMTWNSYEEYMNIRQYVMDNYDLDEDSNFLTTFMPFVANAIADNGDSYNRIDMYGLNVTYEDIEVHVTSIYLEKYSYFSIVTYSSIDENGSEAMNDVVFTYTIDANGNISNLNAYTI